jgi:hypothetical protein
VTSRKKQQKNRSDSVKDWRFHVPPPDHSRTHFTTSANAVCRLLHIDAQSQYCDNRKALNGEFTIDYVELPNGRIPAREFVDSLDDKAAARRLWLTYRNRYTGSSKEREALLNELER